MKKFGVVLLGVFVLGNICLAGFVDSNPAPWRGGERTTYQAWGFDVQTEQVITEPDVWDSPYGPAHLNILGNIPKTRWKDDDLGQQGVWVTEDYVQIHVLNEPQQNPYKEIWMQLTYFADAEIAWTSFNTAIRIFKFKWHGMLQENMKNNYPKKPANLV